MNHPARASAMNTMLKPGLAIEWCADDYPFTDLWLWNHAVLTPNPSPNGEGECPHAHTAMRLRGHIFCPERPIALGMKHGEGLCGGRFHSDRLERYKVKDEELLFLKEHVDERMLDFYREFSEATSTNVLSKSLT
jgi:hypothetical protein